MTTTITQLPNLTRGDTLGLQITFQTDASPPAAVDISNWEVYITFKANASDPDVLAAAQYVYSTNSGASGILTCVVPGEATANLPLGEIYYDIQVVIPAISGHGDVITTILNGTLTVTGDVTLTAV